MLGLMMKDIFSVKKQLKITLLIMFIYIVLSISTHNISFLSFVALFMDLGVLFAVFSYDEKCHWNKYSRILPLDYRKLVLTRYAEVLIVNIILFIILVPISFFVKLPDEEMLMIISILASVISCGVIILSFIMPFIYKYGIEKARIIIYLLIAIPFIGAITITRFINIDIEAVGQLELVNELISHVYIIGPIAALLILVLSYQCSVRVVSKKEY